MTRKHEPRDYVVELGIDADLTVDRSGVYPLQIPLVRIVADDVNNAVLIEPAWFTQLRQHDRIAFRIWDIGTGALSYVDRPCSFQAVFFDPPTGDLKSPFGDDVPNPLDYGRSEIHESHERDHVTGVYPRVGTGWKVGHEPLRIDAPEGRFLLQIRIDVVVAPATLRTYRSDPEVVVGEGSGGGPGGGGSGGSGEPKAKWSWQKWFR